MFGRLPGPAELAEDLRASLDELRERPDAADHVSTTTVDDVPALQADTSAGRLVVTEEQPHQVLRPEPYGGLAGRQVLLEQVAGLLVALPEGGVGVVHLQEHTTQGVVIC